MSRVNPVVSVALLMVVICSAGASAHHSVQAQFDVRGSVTIPGTVAKLEFINPHSYLTVNVKDADGKITKWAFEMGGTTALRQAGLSRADRGGLKVGEAVTATGLPARNGSNSAFLTELNVADGRSFKFLAQN